jgi:diguanylate cyclase (GGDEF)-like protein
VARYSWLCPNELDRERLVSTVRGVAMARVVMFMVLTAVLAGSIGQVGWWPLGLLVVAAAASIYLYRELDKRRHAEYWAAAGWLMTQVPLGVGIAITGGPHSPGLPWLAIAVVSLVARFNRAGICAGMAFLAATLLLDTLVVDPAGTLARPAVPLETAGLLFSVWIFAQALLRSDLEHRDRDPVTGLPNQAMFTEHLRLALTRRERRGGTVSVLSVDLDGFGLANESLGPAAGDELLRKAGVQIALAAVSAELVARRSADEFLILLPDLHAGPLDEPVPSERWQTPHEAARQLARSIQAALADPLHVEGREVYLGASVGISGLAATDEADPTEAVDRLLSQAQLALSGARSAGPGSTLVYDAAQPDSHERLSLITRLRKAIDRDELLLHYQPTVDLHTGEIDGVEALLRWQDPEHGMVPPLKFIGLAEETGLIEPIGAWVIDEIARQARAWQRQKIDVDIAFNLSPRQLWQPDLLPNMIRGFLTTGVEPERLVVEITESSALRDPERTLELLGDMTERGFRLAIDDFGVGLSSLSRLREIPAEVLKIDRSFVAALTDAPDAAVMVQMIIQLADKLGMRAHAEGVETEGERRFLLENGCLYGQGFLFAKPVPASKIPELYLRSLASRLVPLPAISA